MTLFETWAVECYHREIDLSRVTDESSPDFGQYRNATTRAMFATWEGAMRKMRELEEA